MQPELYIFSTTISICYTWFHQNKKKVLFSVSNIPPSLRIFNMLLFLRFYIYFYFSPFLFFNSLFSIELNSGHFVFFTKFQKIFIEQHFHFPPAPRWLFCSSFHIVKKLIFRLDICNIPSLLPPPPLAVKLWPMWNIQGSCFRTSAIVLPTSWLFVWDNKIEYFKNMNYWMFREENI